MIALRAFLKYLRKRGIESLYPERIELAKVGQRDSGPHHSRRAQRLMKAPGQASIGALRDRAIMELFFSTGLRVSELCSLSRDLDLSRDEFSIRGKGEKVRVVFLSPDAKKAIQEYLKGRHDTEDPLFISYGAAAPEASGSPRGRWSE